MSEQLLIASCSLLGMLILAFAALKGWQGWLELKERELNLRLRPMEMGVEMDGGSREGAHRIELSDLKERIRKLEAIANGVDL